MPGVNRTLAFEHDQLAIDSTQSLRLLQLSDSRRLDYVRWNAGGRHPMLFCYGRPGSRLYRPAEPTLLSEIDVDLVTVDRPGYGQSMPQPGRTLLDWPRDVAALVDELGSQRFAVAGISGGGPHALACGRMMPERVTAVGVISGVAPFWPGAVRGMLATTRQGFWLARWAPWLLVLVAGRLKSNRDHFLARLRHELLVCDRQNVDRADVQAVLADNYAESVATREMGHEMILLHRAWVLTFPRCGFASSFGTANATATCGGTRTSLGVSPARLPHNAHSRRWSLLRLRQMARDPFQACFVRLRNFGSAGGLIP